MISSADLTFGEYQDLVNDENRELTGFYLNVASSTWASAYASRVLDFRCVCCGAYVAPLLTGAYDGSTCEDCGLAQEESEDEYVARMSSRMSALVKVYSRRPSGRTPDLKNGRKDAEALSWNAPAPVWPERAVKRVRSLLAFLEA